MEPCWVFCMVRCQSGPLSRMSSGFFSSLYANLAWTPLIWVNRDVTVKPQCNSSNLMEIWIVVRGGEGWIIWSAANASIRLKMPPARRWWRQWKMRLRAHFRLRHSISSLSAAYTNFLCNSERTTRSMRLRMHVKRGHLRGFPFAGAWRVIKWRQWHEPRPSIEFALCVPSHSSCSSLFFALLLWLWLM